MLFGHGTISEFAIASVRGGGVQNVGSPFVSGVAITSGISSLASVTGSAAVSPSTNVATFSLGTEVATGGANVSPTSAGVITSAIGEETAFGEAFQNLVSLSVGSPDFFIWSEIDDSQTVTYTDVEPGSTD